MERGNYRRVRQPQRPRVTDDDIQGIIAIMNKTRPEARVAVIRPGDGFAKTLRTLATIVGMSAGFLRHRPVR